MAIKTEFVEYTDSGVTLEGYLAWDDAGAASMPGVMISHAWAGRSEFECAQARRLAELGYAGFAHDLYGKGVLGGGTEENAKLMQPFLDDRGMLQGRLATVLEVLRGRPMVDASRIAAMGYCFGGLCVLDLARSGGDAQGVVSLHGLLGAPDNTAGAQDHGQGAGPARLGRPHGNARAGQRLRERNDRSRRRLAAARLRQHSPRFHPPRCQRPQPRGPLSCGRGPALLAVDAELFGGAVRVEPPRDLEHNRQSPERKRRVSECATGQRPRQAVRSWARHLRSGLCYPSSGFSTFPCTSVSRKCRP